MFNEFFQMINGIPQWAYGFGWGIILLVIIFLKWFWKNYGCKAFNQWTEKIQKKDKEKEELLYSLRDNEIVQDHWSLEQIIDKCMRKGYRNSEDRKDFMEIYDHYEGIGGNTDGKILLQDFIDIPYKTELKVPEPLGINNPSEKAIKEMLTFYNYIKTGIIHEKDINPIKTKTEYVNNDKNKNNENV